jgi:hypothetical protein
VPVVPGDELGGRPGAGKILTRNFHPPVGLRTDRVDDGVVQVGEIVLRQVAADLDPAQEPEPRLGGDPLERLRDRLDLRMVGSDAEANEPPGRGQTLEHVHLDRQVCAEQVTCGVEARRAGADDRDAQGHAPILERATARQCEQPEPQPPTASVGVSSSTWNEWPQPHAEETFGFSILNPDSWSPSRKSTLAPCR